MFQYFRFVLLQLYLVPTRSSFRSQSTPDENLDVVQVWLVVITVGTFILLGPLIYVVLACCCTSTSFLMTLVSVFQPIRISVIVRLVDLYLRYILTKYVFIKFRPKYIFMIRPKL